VRGNSPNPSNAAPVRPSSPATQSPGLINSSPPTSRTSTAIPGIIASPSVSFLGQSNSSSTGSWGQNGSPSISFVGQNSGTLTSALEQNGNSSTSSLRQGSSSAASSFGQSNSRSNNSLAQNSSPSSVPVLSPTRYSPQVTVAEEPDDGAPARPAGQDKTTLPENCNCSTPAGLSTGGSRPVVLPYKLPSAPDTESQLFGGQRRQPLPYQAQGSSSVQSSPVGGWGRAPPANGDLSSAAYGGPVRYAGKKNNKIILGGKAICRLCKESPDK
jgi:hypothetical protein